MKLEIITIGNELLIGQVVDTNSAWMGQTLNNEGFEVGRITSIEDAANDIKSSLDEAFSRVDVVLMTGGLGPTKDDITKQTLADYFGSKLVFNQTVYDDVCRFLKGRVDSINDLNRGQAFVPVNCEAISNPVGTAPIMWFNHNGKVLVSMPGVPGEMKQAMTSAIIPRLKQRYETGHIIHRTVLVFNVPEAVLAEQLADWEESIPNYISLAYLPSPGRIRLRLTAKSTNEIQANADLDNLMSNLRSIIGDSIYGEEDVAVENLLGTKLLQVNKSLAVAESCTGGHMGHLITSISGSSAYFKGGVIAYENSVKESLLGVSIQDLEKFGAVSREVVEQMAIGVKKALKSDFSLATSGIAGPGGGTEDKPVGTVWVAVAGDFGVISKCFRFGKVRERNIQRAAETAMVMLLKKIEKK
ncbi:competence/damage-inducible protein A [Carboxylicivirga sp. N1Y90]|uniref:competence/damage-inducible protein A n=1 Tax=Carboxylicivirga fragile TaxID=3417571 RepID=UPI003D33F44D|nr:competence/damage-inducible protein A [Marinilabiliaceae bacterium N1Y90]